MAGEVSMGIEKHGVYDGGGSLNRASSFAGDRASRME
jgi:hypothetical protein